MPAKLLTMDMGRGGVTEQIIRLETRIINIEYLLRLSGVSEEQKTRLLPLLVEAETELLSTYEIFELPLSA